MVDFEKTDKYKKGTYAEEIVFNYLRGKGFVVYRPSSGCAHGFDNLAVKDKKKIIIVECKAKARRNYYPDTGINKKHLEDYLYIQEKHNLPVYIFFIDEMEGRIYGNTLDRLMLPANHIKKGEKITYPLYQKGIVYFHLDNMVNIADIEKKQVEFLKKHSTRSYDYQPRI
jgi:hypothetical protein